MRRYVITAIILAGLAYKGVECLRCLSCADVENARHCNRLTECGPNEVCYHTSKVDQHGQITRDLGCRDRLQCQGGSSSVVGRRQSDRILCDSCCDSGTEFCQTRLCGDQEFPSPHGPICFGCDRMYHNNCNTYKICGRDEVCYESLAPDAGTGDILLQTGCTGRRVCDNIKLFGASRRDLASGLNCVSCCDGFLCNNNCTMPGQQSTTTVPAPTSLSPAMTSSSGTACTDRTAAHVCQVASQYVCADRNKALHAGCLHFCGFCQPSTKATAPTSPSPAMTSSSVTACRDYTALDICQVASKYVCTDRDKATNAGCLHFCGFCQPSTTVPAPTSQSPAMTSSSGTTCTDITAADLCRVSAKYVCTDRDKALNAGCLNFCGFCRPSTTATAPTSQSPAMTSASVTPCTDPTAPDICRVAAQYVCSDRDKADHAGCSHFCGLC